MSSAAAVFELGDFALHAGGVLPDAKLVYRTYGTLSAARLTNTCRSRPRSPDASMKPSPSGPRCAMESFIRCRAPRSAA